MGFSLLKKCKISKILGLFWKKKTTKKQLPVARSHETNLHILGTFQETKHNSIDE